MHSALLVFKWKSSSEDEEPADHERRNLTDAISKAKKNNPDIHELGKYVLLIPMKGSGLASFCSIAESTKACGWGLEVHFFEEEPEWSQYAPPKSP
jgi:hypothetical protein